LLFHGTPQATGSGARHLAGFSFLQACFRLVRLGTFAGSKPASAPGLSLWKNEGKNHSRRSGKGGFESPDALYDSQPKLTGFSLV
jgi:hypothetical protein